MPPRPETTFSPIEPGDAPWPLFQWYVVIDARQYVFLPVENVAGLPPFCTPPPFVLSNSVFCGPEHVYVVPLGMAGTTLIGPPSRVPVAAEDDAARTRKAMTAGAARLRKASM